MPRRTFMPSSPFALVIAAVAALACSDSLAPRAASEGVSDASQATITTGAPASGKKASGGGRTSSGGGYTPTAAPEEAPTATPEQAPTDAPLGAPMVMKFASWAPPLATYDTSFSVVVGSASTHLVMFKGSPIPFMKVAIPANADFFGADGKAIRAGQTVSVSVAIDRVSAAVTFGPHGTLFTQQKPAKLYLNYFFLDLAGRSPSALAIWYQPTEGLPWQQQPTSLEVEFWWLVAPLYHFSNYAIAY